VKIAAPKGDAKEEGEGKGEEREGEVSSVADGYSMQRKESICEDWHWGKGEREREKKKMLRDVVRGILRTEKRKRRGV